MPLHGSPYRRTRRGIIGPRGIAPRASAPEPEGAQQQRPPSMELFFALSYCMCLATLVVPNFVGVPINVAMVATAFFAIVVGSHRSLLMKQESDRTGESKVRNPLPTWIRTQLQDTGPDITRACSPQVERISTKDAVYFPLVASAGLFTLFLVFTFFKQYVSVMLTLYALTLGTFSTASMIGPAVEFVLPGWCTTKKLELTLPEINIPYITEPTPPDAKGECHGPTYRGVLLPF
jgi:hypothetical protein